MVRSADPTRPDVEQTSGAFAAQLALAEVHPALAPQRRTSAGYAFDPGADEPWFSLSAGRGFAGYGLARALRMLLDLLAGLSALHDTQTESGAGFVHGELVPAMVRVDPQGVARLLPIAPWHWQSTEAPLSPDSLGHLAPERLLGDAIDGRADVFSAGVLLWEALAGRRLFEREPVDAIITRLMGGKVLLPELPPELAWAIPLKAVALRALAVDPEQRFADCAALAAAIEAAAGGRVASHALVAAHLASPPKRANSLPPPLPRLPSLEEGFRLSHKSSLSALVAPTIAHPATASELPRPRAGRRRRAAWTVTVLVCVLVGLGGAAVNQRNRLWAVARGGALSAAGAPTPVAALASEPVAPSASSLSAQLAPSAPVASSASAELAPSASLGRDAVGVGAVPPAAPGRAVRPERAAGPLPVGKARTVASKLIKPRATGRTPAAVDKAADKYGI